MDDGGAGEERKLMTDEIDVLIRVSFKTIYSSSNENIYLFSKLEE